MSMSLQRVALVLSIKLQGLEKMIFVCVSDMVCSRKVTVLCALWTPQDGSLIK